MMTNNMMSNINKNKNLLSKLDEQYSTGKKIQRPSEDPIIAVRALKLRTNLSELNQYYEKNIPDARSWMSVTEEAMKNMNEILTKINSSCVQGATDSLTASDRSSIVETLEEMKKQIYQEGNANYA
jgi:flagellar hook-associated protein 3 FlgL